MLRAVGAGLILCASLLARRRLLDDARAVQRTRRSLAAGVFERAVVIGNDGGTRAYAVEDVPCSAGSARG